MDRAKRAVAVDLRTLVRARMAELGLDQAALAALVAPAWGRRGIQPDSAVKKLSRWFNRRGDMTTDAFAAMLVALDLTITRTP